MDIIDFLRPVSAPDGLRQPSISYFNASFFARRTEDGGAKEARTPDLLNAIQALYQLSYDPIHNGTAVYILPAASQNFLPIEMI